jgi:hypothetical protein
MKSIFIQIPAYRDHELNNTVRNMVENASGFIKLSFGIHNCVLFSGETNVDINYPFWVTVNYAESIAPKNIGLQKSRYIANEFYNGEDYYLQIDSHMRFVKNWDAILITDLEKITAFGINKPIITMYPAEYSYDENGNVIFKNGLEHITEISFFEDIEKFENTLIPSQTAVTARENCVFTPSVSGGFIFTYGNFSRIKPNKKIAFWGEEPLIAARAFTHGFTPVVPLTPVVGHLYIGGKSFEKTRRHHVWTDFSKEWEILDAESKAEYKAILINRVIGEGALGAERTLDEYEEFSGLNFRDRTAKVLNAPKNYVESV